ncbi:MAG TPA: hypothetical protein VIG42_07060 [Solirubrobacteraceae bacterium]
MDQQVAKTLSELELKLQELERELTSIGRGDKLEESPRTSGTLIDEAVEGESTQSADGQPSAAGHAVGHAATADGDPTGADETAAPEGDGFGGPAVFGGEEVPAQAGATVERDWTVEIRETAYGEIPTPPSPAPQSDPLHLRTPAPAPAPPPQPPPTTAPGPHSPASPPGVYPPSAPRGVHSPSSSPGWSPPPDPRRPAAVEESRSVDLAELVRFRDKLARTMDDLIDEYSRLLPAERLPRRRPSE